MKMLVIPLFLLARYLSFSIFRWNLPPKEGATSPPPKGTVEGVEHSLKVVVSKRRLYRSTLLHCTGIWLYPLQLSKLLKYGVSKGQLISKGLFTILNSSKKWTKKFDSTTMIPHVDLLLFIFWRNLKTQKIRFEINWP